MKLPRNKVEAMVNINLMEKRPSDDCFFAMSSLLEVAELLNEQKVSIDDANAEDEAMDIRGNIIHNLWRIAVKDYIMQIKEEGARDA